VTIVQNLFLCCAISIIWAFPVNAGVENRPLNTDDAYTLNKGALTASLGVVFTSAENQATETDLTIDFGYGITARLEVTVDIPIAFTNPKNGSTEEGLSDISIRPEFLLIKEQESLPAISFAATFKTESGNKDKGLGSGETDYSLSLQFSKFFDPSTYHFNIGFTFVGEPEGENLDDVIFYNLGFEYSMNDRLDLTGELIGETNSDPSSNNEPFEFLLAFIYAISQTMALDVGVGAGLTDASPDFRATSGVTYEF